MRSGRFSTGAKRATNVSLDAAMVDDARALGVNVSAACETGLRQEVKAARAAAWLAENRGAIASWNAYVDEHGVPLARFRPF